jgi:hypothetical protein
VLTWWYGPEQSVYPPLLVNPLLITALVALILALLLSIVTGPVFFVGFACGGIAGACTSRWT